MDFAFIYILVASITLAIKVAFFIVASFSIFVVGFVGQDVWRMIKERQRRNELH
jgi:hypothetical protein